MTTYRSESRGFMYTAPPSGEQATDTDAVTEQADENADERATETPDLDPTAATTDANWTGTVPADD